MQQNAIVGLPSDIANICSFTKQSKANYPPHLYCYGARWIDFSVRHCLYLLRRYVAPAVQRGKHKCLPYGVMEFGKFLRCGSFVFTVRHCQYLLRRYVAPLRLQLLNQNYFRRLIFYSAYSFSKYFSTSSTIFSAS